MITQNSQNRKSNLTPELRDKLESLPPWVIDEMKSSAIAPDVTVQNVKHRGGYNGFTWFVDQCNIENARTQGGAITAEASKYNHMYDGFWCVNGCPQVKPKSPKAYVEMGDNITHGHGFINDDKTYNRKLKEYPTVDEIELRGLDIPYGKLQSIAFKNNLNPPKNDLSDKLEWCKIFGVKVKIKVIKYENIKGKGTPYTFIDIPFRVIRYVAKKYKIDSLPKDTYHEKWSWIADNPQIPISITEGVKKAMALVSNNIIAIACISITTHSNKKIDGQNAFQTELKDEIKPYVGNDRTVYITFDSADKKISSRRSVERQTYYLATKLEKNKCKVKIVRWTDQECKGIDDFIFKHGRLGLKALYLNPLGYGVMKVSSLLNKRRLTNAIKINTRRLVKKDGTVDPQILKRINSLIKLVCIKSQQSTGKTQVIEALSKLWQYHGLKILSITPSQFLAEDQSKRIGIHCYKDKVTNTNVLERNYGLSSCIDSILKIPEDEHFDIVFLDEIEQLMVYMLTSNTNMAEHRLEKIERLLTYLRRADKIIVADADLSDYTVKFLQGQLGIGDNDTAIIENSCKPFKNRELHSFASVDALRYHLKSLVSANLDEPLDGRPPNDKKKRFFITSSSQKELSKNSAVNLSTMLINLGVPDDEIIVLDAETTKDPENKAYKITKNLTNLSKYTYVIASPTLTTGVSLNIGDVGEFNYVFGFFGGNYLLDSFSQQIERYRGDCIRFVYVPEASKCLNKSLSGSTKQLRRLIGERQRIAKNSFDLEENLDDLHIDLQGVYCKFTARSNNEKYHLRDLFEALSEMKGYTVVRIPKSGVGSFDKNLVKTIRKEAAQIVDANTKGRAIDTAQSIDLDSITAQKIKDKDYKKRCEILALEKYRLKKRYGENNVNAIINENIDGFIELYKLNGKGKLYHQLVNSFFMGIEFHDVRKIEKARVKKDEAYRKKEDEKTYFLHALGSINRLSVRALFEVLGISFDEIKELKDKGDHLINNNHEIMALLKTRGRRTTEDQSLVNDFLDELMSQTAMDELLDRVDQRLTVLNQLDPMTLRLVGMSLNQDANNSNRKMQRLRSVLALIGYELEIVARTVINGDQTRIYRIIDRADRVKKDFRSSVFAHFDQTLINFEDLATYAMDTPTDEAVVA